MRKKKLCHKLLHRLIWSLSELSIRTAVEFVVFAVGVRLYAGVISPQHLQKQRFLCAEQRAAIRNCRNEYQIARISHSTHRGNSFGMRLLIAFFCFWKCSRVVEKNVQINPITEMYIIYRKWILSLWIWDISDSFALILFGLSSFFASGALTLFTKTKTWHCQKNMKNALHNNIISSNAFWRNAIAYDLFIYFLRENIQFDCQSRIRRSKNERKKSVYRSMYGLTSGETTCCCWPLQVRCLWKRSQKLFLFSVSSVIFLLFLIFLDSCELWKKKTLTSMKNSKKKKKRRKKNNSTHIFSVPFASNSDTRRCIRSIKRLTLVYVCMLFCYENKKKLIFLLVCGRVDQNFLAGVTSAKRAYYYYYDVMKIPLVLTDYVGENEKFRRSIVRAADYVGVTKKKLFVYRSVSIRVDRMRADPRPPHFERLFVRDQVEMYKYWT